MDYALFWDKYIKKKFWWSHLHREPFLARSATAPRERWRRWRACGPAKNGTFFLSVAFHFQGLPQVHSYPAFWSGIGRQPTRMTTGPLTSSNTKTVYSSRRAKWISRRASFLLWRRLICRISSCRTSLEMFWIRCIERHARSPICLKYYSAQVQAEMWNYNETKMDVLLFCAFRGIPWSDVVTGLPKARSASRNYENLRTILCMILRRCDELPREHIKAGPENATCAYSPT